jgi:hypothetical protein
VSSVAPGRTLARMKARREAAELSGIAASRTRPERVSRYFALNFRGLARFGDCRGDPVHCSQRHARRDINGRV